MHEHFPRLRPSWLACAAGAWVLALAVGPAHGQTGSESSVGYIDTAIPTNMFRLRGDFAYNYPFPDRGEFMYSHSDPGLGNDPAEVRADFQELYTYVEAALGRRLSLFAEVPVRAINPTFDPNAVGLSDICAGFKWAFLYREDLVASFQLRSYAQTGDSEFHLGSGHPTLEPGLLGWTRLAPGLTAEGELRLWVPIGGDPDFDSHVLRYGVGASYNAWEARGVVVTPVVEVVGWSFLDGQKSVNSPAGQRLQVDAGGDTIVNLKLGVRFRTGVGDFYAGYARPLTGDTFYRDFVRVEYRLTW